MNTRSKKWLMVGGVALISFCLAFAMHALAQRLPLGEIGFVGNHDPAPLLSIIIGVGATSVLASPVITIFYRKTGIIYLLAHIGLWTACAVYWF